jgi:hypothetical protein
MYASSSPTDATASSPAAPPPESARARQRARPRLLPLTRSRRHDAERHLDPAARAAPGRHGRGDRGTGDQQREQCAGLRGAARGIERAAFASLALSRWVENATTLLISGPTGSGKSWLACALAQHACRRGHSALYLRVPRLAEELRILHGNGGFATWLAALARTDVLILDDWALAPQETGARADLLEMIDDRAGTRPTILTTQLPVSLRPESEPGQHWSVHLQPAVSGTVLRRRIQPALQLLQGLRSEDRAIRAIRSIGLEGGINTYAYAFGNPLSYVDPEGLAGHHLVPQAIWRNEPLRPETARVFDRATTGPIPGGHNFGDGHSAYSKAVQEMWDKAKAGGVNCQSMTPNQAEDFVRQVRQSQDPRIRDFNHRIYRRTINGAFRSVPYRGGPD